MGRLLFIDGFDHYQDAAHLADKWTSSTGCAPDPTAGRSGNGLKPTGIANCSKTLAANYGELIVGFAVNWLAFAPGVTSPCVAFTNNGSGPIIGIGVNAAGALVAYAGVINGDPATVLGTSANGLVVLGQYYSCEYHFNISAGTFIARLNGAQVMSLTGLTFTAATVNQIMAHTGTSSPGAWYIDDLYLLDPTDAPVNAYDQAPNGFLGDVRVALATVSGNGRVNNFLPAPSGDANWQTVDDPLPDDDVSYAASNNVGDIDLYTIAPPAVDVILGVQLVALLRKDAAGARIVDLGVGNGTTEVFGADRALGATYTYQTQTYAGNPLTGAAWGPGDLATLQLGVKVSG